MNSTSSPVVHRQSCAPSKCCFSCKGIRQDELLQDTSEASPRRWYSSSHAKLRQSSESWQPSLLDRDTEIGEEEDAWRSFHPQSRRRRHGIRSLQGCLQRRERQLACQPQSVSISEGGQRRHAREAAISEGEEFRRQSVVFQTD